MAPFFGKSAAAPAAYAASEYKPSAALSGVAPRAGSNPARTFVKALQSKAEYR
jgi:hypothetical protein